MTSQIEEIKDRLDIAQVISEYIKLKKVGANYRALCPFHSEKNPSFYVSPSRQIWHCFGCGKGGDVFKFVMMMEGTEFKEALEILAKKAGVEIRREPIQTRTEKQRILDICELATKFFEKQLGETKTGKKAKEYLLSRKISQESIEKWRLGYAPNTWRGLSDFLVSKGYKRTEIVKAGLAVESEDKEKSTPYDRFRGRIMFPIFNLQGQVIGFGGRTTEDIKTITGKELSSTQHPESKYINTPNTLVYSKSRILYGVHEAKTEVRKKDNCILVEGYTDVILSSQEGTKNIVSTSGITLTPYQLKVLSRYTKNFILGFDMDIAGEAATQKGIDIAQFQGFNIKIVSLPEGKDPADVISENPGRWQKLIETSQEIVNFYFQKALKGFNKKTLEGKKEISKLLLPFIARIQNKIEQAHWIKELAKELNVKEEAIWEEVKKTTKEQKVGTEIPETPEIEEREKPKTRQRLLEERLLMLFLKFPEEIRKNKEILKFSFEEGEKLFQSLRGGEKLPKDLSEFISLLELQYEFEREKGEINPEQEIQFCINSLQKFSKDEKIRKIINELKIAEAAGDKNKISKLLKKISQL